MKAIIKYTSFIVVIVTFISCLIGYFPPILSNHTYTVCDSLDNLSSLTITGRIETREKEPPYYNYKIKSGFNTFLKDSSIPMIHVTANNFEYYLLDKKGYFHYARTSDSAPQFIELFFSTAKLRIENISNNYIYFPFFIGARELPNRDDYVKIQPYDNNSDFIYKFYSNSIDNLGNLNNTIYSLSKEEIKVKVFQNNSKKYSDEYVYSLKLIDDSYYGKMEKIK